MYQQGASPDNGTTFEHSIDHELLVVSRLKGLRHAVRSHEDELAGQRQPTGRITTAAVQPSIVFLAVVSSVVVCMKPSASELMVAVLMAAFVIRHWLACAAITLVGRASGSARRLLRRRRPDPEERYRIDPQFVLRGVERAT